MNSTPEILGLLIAVAAVIAIAVVLAGLDDQITTPPEDEETPHPKNR